MGRKKKIRGTEEEKVNRALPKEDRDREGLSSGEPRAPEPTNPVNDKMIDNLSMGAASEDGNATFMDPVAKKKRKYTKRQKEDEKPAVDPKIQLEETKIWVRQLVELNSTLGVKVAEDPRAEMGPQVKEIATASGAGCVMQYAPDLLGKHSNAIVLASVMTQFWANVWLLRRENLARLIAERKRGIAHDNSEVYNQPGLQQ